MRKIIERIELNEEDVIKYSKFVYEYNAAQDMFIASAKKGLDLDAEIVDKLLKDALVKKMELTKLQDEYVDKFIPEAYKTSEYQWAVDANRNQIEIYQEV